MIIFEDGDAPKGVLSFRVVNKTVECSNIDCDDCGFWDGNASCTAEILKLVTKQHPEALI